MQLTRIKAMLYLNWVNFKKHSGDQNASCKGQIPIFESCWLGLMKYFEEKI